MENNEEYSTMLKSLFRCRCEMFERGWKSTKGNEKKIIWLICLKELYLRCSKRTKEKGQELPTTKPFLFHQK